MSGLVLASHCVMLPLFSVALRPFTFHEQIVSVVTAQTVPDPASVRNRPPSLGERNRIHDEATSRSTALSVDQSNCRTFVIPRGDSTYRFVHGCRRYFRESEEEGNQ